VYFPPQSRREPPIRLFRWDWVEALTRVPPVLVVIVWAPIIGWFGYDAWSSREVTGMTAGRLVTAHALGLLAWTLVEYVLHRFVFHFSPRNPPPWLHRLVFLFHGIHHAQPWDKTRLVMPPPVSIPLAVLFYWLFGALAAACGSPAWLAPVFAAFLAGYLIYDLLHYATHHLPMAGPVGRWLKRHHLRHHYVTPNERFGVSSPLWDLVLRTLPDDQEEAADEQLHVS
jgi:sterol desaturase/sphingolipid hydroxylase (fatty acid hydroxylase superfamily)